jgi:hypothetical protein
MWSYSDSSLTIVEESDDTGKGSKSGAGAFAGVRCGNSIRLGLHSTVHLAALGGVYWRYSEVARQADERGTSASPSALRVAGGKMEDRPGTKKYEVGVQGGISNRDAGAEYRSPCQYGRVVNISYAFSYRRGHGKVMKTNVFQNGWPGDGASVVTRRVLYEFYGGSSMEAGS